MSAVAEPVITVSGLVNRFGRNIVHDGLELEVCRGEILGVVGGSGSGKSVLLRSIVGLIEPEHGDITVLGRSLDRVLREGDAEFQQRVGVMFQDGALFSSLTVRENIEIAIREHFDIQPSLVTRLACLKIALSGLSWSAGSQYPAALSGGMRKRAGLARALALDPEILFLDEPTAGLDPITAAGIDELLVTLRDALGLTIFLVTHDLDTLQAVCDRVAVLAEGRVLTIGSLADVAGFDHPWVQDYFNGPRGRNAAAAHRVR